MTDPTEGGAPPNPARGWWIALRAASVTVLLVWLVSRLLGPGGLEQLENHTVDWRFAFRAHRVVRHPAIRLIYLDDSTLDAPGLADVPFALWLPYFGQLSRALLNAGAKVVGIDFLLNRFPNSYYQTIFDQQHTPPDEQKPYWDLGLAGGIEHPGQLVLGTFPDLNNIEANRVVGQAELIASVGADNTAFLTLPAASDGVVRKQVVTPVKMSTEYLGFEYCSPFAARLAERFTEANITVDGVWGKAKVPIDSDGGILINYFPSQVGGSFDERNRRSKDLKGPFPTFTMEQVLEWARQGSPELQRNFEGTAVIIGPGAYSMQDVHPVSGGGQRPGPEIHATVLNQLLTAAYLRKPPAPATLGLAWLLCFLTGLLTFRFRFTAGLTVVAALWLTYTGAACALFIYADLVLEVARPLLAAALTWALVLGSRLRREESEKRVVRQLFGRYVSDEVMEHLLRDPKQAVLGAVGRRRVTVLFSDINGFSTICEQRSPEQIMAMLNAYFEEMNQILFLHGGTIKQFVGDEIMVLFGAPIRHILPESAAVHAGIEMVRRLRQLERQSPTKQDGFYHIKIGIHTGEVILGNVGSSRRTEYAAVGDDVNLGSRIMGMTKTLGAHILISAATYQEVKDMAGVRFVNKGKHAVRGRREPIELYAVEEIAETEGGTVA